MVLLPGCLCCGCPTCQKSCFTLTMSGMSLVDSGSCDECSRLSDVSLTLVPAVADYPFNGLCVFTGFACAVCPEWLPAQEIPGQTSSHNAIGAAMFVAGDSPDAFHRLIVFDTNSAIVVFEDMTDASQGLFAATAPAYNNDGIRIPCEDLVWTVEEEHVHAADGIAYRCTGGTVSMTAVNGACPDSDAACDLPDQIALTARWPGFTWSCPPGYPEGYNCNQNLLNSEYTEKTLIFDRVQYQCATRYVCGQEAFEFRSRVGTPLVTISPPDDTPAWYPVRPQRETATAAVTGVVDGAITAISVTDGGSGYRYEIYERLEPDVTASASGGTGADLTVTLTKTGTGDNAVWGVQSISVDDGGSGYPEHGSVTFSIAGDDAEQSPAVAAFLCGTREEPTVTVSGIVNGYAASTGSGAVLGVNLTETTDANGLPTWKLPWFYSSQTGSFTINNGGSGYSVGNFINLSVDGTEPDAFYEWGIQVIAVDGNGAITDVYVSFDRKFYKSNSTGVISSVVVTAAGEYFKPNATGTYHTSIPIVTFSLGTGAGAVATATVSSAGEVSAVTVTDGGAQYILGNAWWLRFGTYQGAEYEYVQLLPLRNLAELSVAFFWDGPVGAPIPLDISGGDTVLGPNPRPLWVREESDLWFLGCIADSLPRTIPLKKVIGPLVAWPDGDHDGEVFQGGNAHVWTLYGMDIKLEAV